MNADMTWPNFKKSLFSLPPKHDLVAHLNWIQLFNPEGVAHQDEMRLIPQRRKDAFDNDTDYTLGDVWLEDGQSSVALLRVISGKVTHIHIYHDDDIWEIAFMVSKEEDLRRQSLTLEARRKSPARQAWVCRHKEDTRHLPMPYCTRLVYASTKMQVKAKILPDGNSIEWDDSLES